MAANLTRDQAITYLRRLGWRIRSTGEYNQAVKNFQRGWNLGAALSVDGIVGPHTSAALRLSEARRAARLGTASAHFSFSEFACKCGGRYSSCQRIWILRTQVRAMEVYRARVGGPVGVVSGCRCVSHNHAVGGASSSQHMYGTACDIGYALHDTTVAALHVFSGIGRSASTHLVRHVDTRASGPNNTTSASNTHPTDWNYAS